ICSCRSLLGRESRPFIIDDGAGVAANRGAQPLLVGSACGAQTVEGDQRIALGENHARGLLVALPDVARKESDQQAKDEAGRDEKGSNDALEALDASAQPRSKREPDEKSPCRDVEREETRKERGDGQREPGREQLLHDVLTGW